MRSRGRETAQEDWTDQSVEEQQSRLSPFSSFPNRVDQLFAQLNIYIS